MLFNVNVDALNLFHPLIAGWFRERVGEPTDVQAECWERVAAGGHVLVTAPTGSGKTLAAFLWAINELVSGRLKRGHTSVLYVSPLRALNNDIQRNLVRPLNELRLRFEQAGLEFPAIDVETRSGDTPPPERARMLRHPPEILITTPESLNLMVSSRGGREALRSLATVILDEIHAVLGNKRGVYLMTAVERLVPLSGEFQRISLSATVRSPELAAKFVGGFRLEGDPRQPTYSARTVVVVRSRTSRRYEIAVRFREPEITDTKVEGWGPTVAEYKDIIRRNRSTLLFANSRRLCERLALAINEGEEEPLVYVHHGSLSREIRAEVEKRLRDGELKGVVATNSLELGIDIGALDEVVLVQPPPTVSAAIQRIGRSRHHVGEVCKGTIFPVGIHDLLEGAVLPPLIKRQETETVEPVRSPLDVLAQVIVAMVGVEKWDIDELYGQVRTAYPYRELDRRQFDLVLNMLAGRYADSQIRELKPQVSIDRIDNTVTARRGALLSVYTSGGVIPDRGYFHLRHKESGALIGELDEEFVWEARIGDTFSLGAQNWRIERITHNDVFVLPAPRGALAAPFWHGDENYRDFHFSQLVGEFLERANADLESPGFADLLKREYAMDETAAGSLIAFLKRQREATSADLPHRRHLLVEVVKSGPGGAPGVQLILHTIWGNRVNRPYAMAMDAACEEKYGQRIETYTSNDCVIFQLPPEIPAEEIVSLVTSANVESMLRKRLESSGFFGARFRECAGRALLLPRSRVGERMPLWMTRLRSQKLLSAVFKYEDFPILLETWRTCLVDEFDLASLKLVLSELEAGVVRWTEAHTDYPSPFAQHLMWRQTNEYMYMTDELQLSAVSRLREDLIRHVVLTPGLRPSVEPELVAQFLEKRQRLAPGYSPEDGRELVDWVKERVLIPESEWERLREAMRRDSGDAADRILKEASHRLVRVRPQNAGAALVAPIEDLSRTLYGLYAGSEVAVSAFDPAGPAPAPANAGVADTADEVFNALLGQWLRYYGPLEVAQIAAALGVESERLSLLMEEMVDSEQVITGQLVSGSTQEHVCDADNFETLLRMARRAAVPAFETREAEQLPLFLAHHQGLAAPGGDTEAVFGALEHLRCLPLPAELWEQEVLPARLQGYLPSWLDAAMQEARIRWVGSGRPMVALCSEDEITLLKSEDGLAGEAESGVAEPTEAASIFPDARGRYDFLTLLRITGLTSKELSERLWEGVWQGRVSNDTFAALRKGIMTRFEAPEVTGSRRRPGRSGFSRWRGSLPFAGNWFLLPEAEPASDLLESEERLKERARLLLDRYGIVFRELLDREAVPMRWGRVFRALRLMELSGEVLSGYFFRGIPGPQFISPGAFALLQGGLNEDRVWWLNAADPASLCGVDIQGLKQSLPRRVSGNHVVYHGTKVVVISEQNGRVLSINAAPDHPRLVEYLGVLRHLLGRQFQPLHRVVVETVNGQPAAESRYVNTLKTLFDVVVQGREVVLYRKTRPA